MAAITNGHKLSDSKQKCVLSQFWGIEVQNQAVSRAMLSLEVSGENPPLPLPSFLCLLAIPGVSILAHKCITLKSASVITCHSAWVSLIFTWCSSLCGLCLNVPFLLRTVDIELGASLIQQNLILT